MSLSDHALPSTLALPRDLAPAALVGERVRGAGHEAWLGWIVDEHQLVVAVAGDICVSVSNDLAARIGELAWEFPRRTVILDLSRVPFADARAVTALVRLDRMCEQSGSTLAVTACSHAVERLLWLCGWPGAVPAPRDESSDVARHRDGEAIAVRRGVDPVRN